MSESVIQVRSLGKRYQLGTRERYRTFRESLTQAMTAPARRVVRSFRRTRRGAATDAPGTDDASTIWALKDVTFDVRHGEVLGIIGRNGAGKSTLLKILSRITSPTTGSVELQGRVGSLLEVGTGFHPELSGRENIFLNGAILGMGAVEIRRKFDEIVAFSEVERFLETPVKRYSSGMYMRLAFAVAAHLEPEVLVVDEVLAVGDAAFQKKCLGKMGEVARQGRTVLFVSHNMGAVSSLCGRTIELADGQVRAVGPTEVVVRKYLSEGFERRPGSLSKLRLPGCGDEVRFTDAEIVSADGTSNVPFGAAVVFRLTIESGVDISDLSVGCSLFEAGGGCIGTLFTREQFSIAASGQVGLTLTIDNASLAPGLYYAGFSLGRGGHDTGRHDLDVVIGQPSFQVLPVSDGHDVVSNWHSNWGRIVLRARLAVEPVALHDGSTDAPGSAPGRREES